LDQNASNRVASSANAKLHITRQQPIALPDRLEAVVGEDGAEVRARSKKPTRRLSTMMLPPL
jgi:hypothetical protein